MAYIRFQGILDRLLESNVKVFTIHEASKLLGKPHKYTSLILSRSDKLRRVERGVYFIKGADIYEIASNIARPSYVSMFSAISYYGVTTQLPVRMSVMAVSRHRQVSAEGYRIEFTTLKRERFFGYARAGNAYIATLEKAFVDSLYLNAVSYSELKDALGEALEKGAIRTDLLKRYAGAMKSRALISRLGVLLDDLRIDSDDLGGSRSMRKVGFLGYRGKSKRWNVA